MAALTAREPFFCLPPCGIVEKPQFPLDPEAHVSDYQPRDEASGGLYCERVSFLPDSDAGQLTQFPLSKIPEELPRPRCEI